MGLIRKTLAVSTIGLVRPNSKKQRVAKAQLKELKEQTRIMAEQERQAQLDREAAFAAKPTPSLTGNHQERMAELARIRAAANGAVEPSPAPAAVTLPPEGWYPHPDRQDLLRWWDGADWTDRTAPRV